MSSLWTPGGEHRVPREGEGTPEPGTSGRPTGRDRAGSGSGSGAGGPAVHAGADGPAVHAGAGGPAVHAGAGRSRAGGDEQADEELLDEMRQLSEQLLASPAAEVIANHCYGLFELAALHLGAAPPQLVEARLAIDALAALVDGLAGRLGEAEPTLKEALAQIRLAFVQLASSSG